MKLIALALPLLLAIPKGNEGLIFFGGVQPRAAVNADGGIALTFLFENDIQIAFSGDDGQTWSAPRTAIDCHKKGRAGAQRGPRVGWDAKKALYVTAPVCFDAEELKAKNPAPELWLAISPGEGQPFGEPIQVNDAPKSAPEALHDMVVAPSGEVHVAWLDRRARAKDNGQDLFYAKVVDGKAGKNLKIADNVCPCCAPAIAVDAAGNPTVVYRDGSNNKSRELFWISSKDGGAKWGKPARLTKSNSDVPNCPMDAPAVAVSPDGKTGVAAWMDLRSGLTDANIFYSTFSGGTFGKDVALPGDTTGDQKHPSIALDSKGVMHAAWESGTGKQRKIMYGRSEAGYAPEEVNRKSDGECSYPTVALCGVVCVFYEMGGRTRDDGHGVAIRRVKR